MRKIVTSLLTLVLLASCHGSGPAASPVSPPPGAKSSSPTISPSSPAASPTDVTPPRFDPNPPTRGAITSSCTHGWTTPAANSSLYLQPLGIIRRTTGVKGPLVVVDMRYFNGPESPDVDSLPPNAIGYLVNIQRWYIRLYAKDDPAFQGRFLVESRVFGRGLSAVAPWNTHGWHSPDWVGFQWNSADLTGRTYKGLPGTWEGIAYNFVTGGAGINIPGLPPEVTGCLAGT